METDEEEQRVTPFQLQFDKPVASQVKIAEWNPEKDLLAMVTEDSKILLHRFNWQRLWTISPGKSITSLCWRPDGKAIAVGLEDGTVSLHDVEFSNFFNWLLKCIKLLNSEPSDHHLLLYNSELVVIFLKFLYDQDPVKQLLEASEADESIEVGLETVQRVRELVQFGGFSDCEHLQRTLAKEFQQMESSFKEAFQMPFITISRKIVCEDSLPLCPLPPSSASLSISIPMSVSYYEDASRSVPHQTRQHMFLDYISFHIPDESFSGMENCIGIVRGIMHDSSIVKRGYTSVEAVLLCIPVGYYCVDLSLYKESQIVLLLNETTTTSESSGDACMMVVQANDLPFVSITRSTSLNYWNLHQLKDSVVHLQMENEKVRSIPHSVIAPLAVSSSRGVACVFAARKRALVYILEEDEDEVSDSE